MRIWLLRQRLKRKEWIPINPKNPIWTGDVVGLMHVYGITREAIAERLGLSTDYIGMILRGKRCPTDARETLINTVKEMILANDREADQGDRAGR